MRKSSDPGANLTRRSFLKAATAAAAAMLLPPAALGEAEVSVVDGGQPVYYYMISLE